MTEPATTRSDAATTTERSDAQNSASVPGESGEFCGSTKGYHIHRRAGERACLDCRQAHAADMRSYLNRSGKRELFNARMRARTAALAALRTHFIDEFVRIAADIRASDSTSSQGVINRKAVRALRQRHRREYLDLYELALPEEFQRSKAQSRTTAEVTS